ncbi:aldehyde dehydrogenase [Yinghuangia sp. YIM S09857]|uniref:aldehyde dehydrogenase n=1 Tax=Yinghuangia sp. YIM S09857 TaxID=3436929 RepID=UPI003F536429
MYHHDMLFIGGHYVRPPGPRVTVEVVNPADESVVGSFPAATAADVDDAVAAARNALDSPAWGGLSPVERTAALVRFADALETNLVERAALTTLQNGMPIALALDAEGAGPVGLLRYYAALASVVPAEETRPRLDGSGCTVVTRDPVGVVAAVVPWNFPQTLTMFKLAPALAAGCTVVLKPAPETTLDAYALADAALAAGLPPGVLSVVPGGADIGELLVTHPGVDKVAFTGSTAAGRRIGEVCGRLLRPVSLELGGKSAAILLDDADVEDFAGRLAAVSLLNNGQTCHLSTRILVPRGHHNAVAEVVGAVAASLVVGDPMDPATGLGPLVSRRQRARVEAHIAAAISAGTTVVTGGGARPRDRGWFVAPAVFADVDNGAPLAREEVFGPVLAVIPYRDTDEAVRLANDSPYGLAGTVWTSDPERGLAVARQVETGTIGVNDYSIDAGAPFGGVKASGIGRELGPEGLAAFTVTKSVYLSAGLRTPDAD